MPAVSESRYMVQASWEDVPHLSEQSKIDMLSSTPPHMVEARSAGEPTMGSGNVYPIPIKEITVQPFQFGKFWKRGYALDVGWNRTAALWGAQSPSDGVLFVYAEHYRGRAIPAEHIAAIKARGDWITGAIDPAARGRGQGDGKVLLTEYRNGGLKLIPAVNAVDAGLTRVWEMLSTGQLKVFSTLQNFFAEYRVYRRDEDGKIIEEHQDHLMDCLRYLVMTWDKIATLPAVQQLTGARGFGSADSKAGY